MEVLLSCAGENEEPGLLSLAEPEEAAGFRYRTFTRRVGLLFNCTNIHMLEIYAYR